MLGILCGLASEAALLRGLDGVIVACAGSRPQRARWLARELVRDGATRLLSFGIAGSLEPGLPVGTLVIGTQVQSVDGTSACDARWIDRMAQALPAAHCGPVWGSEIVIPSAGTKRALYQRSRCLTVDMESHCVAQIAAEARLPFNVLRAVSDNSETGVPFIAEGAIDDEGHVRGLNILLNMLRHPIIATRQIPAMVTLGRGTNRALVSLRGATGFLKI